MTLMLLPRDEENRLTGLAQNENKKYGNQKNLFPFKNQKFKLFFCGIIVVLISLQYTIRALILL